MLQSEFIYDIFYLKIVLVLLISFKMVSIMNKNGIVESHDIVYLCY